MRKLLLTLTLLFTTLLSFALTPKDTNFFLAMQDEMQRTIAMLKTENMAKPYFAAYKVTDISAYNFSAVMGSLTRSRATDSVSIKVLLRVGNQKEDNSFFSTYLISSAEGQTPGKGYDSLRAGLWGASDEAYKTALAQLAKKQAYKKSKNITEEFPDFSKAETTEYIEEISRKTIDKNYWEDVARLTSEQGKIEELEEFNTNIAISLRPTYFLSSEGAKYLKDRYSIIILFQARGKTKNGFEIEETKQLSYMDFKDVPSKEKLVSEAASFAKDTATFTKAEKSEPFIGPVLLEDYAAAVLFNDAFRNNIIRTKKVLSATSDTDYSMGEFAQKAGLKIMPADFDVIDDPTLKTFKGTKLAGTYMIDDEGVKAGKLQLVKNGKLTAMPTTRSLIKDQKASNGHAVINGDFSLFSQAGVGNLFFFPHETIPAKELKAKLMEYCSQEGLDYCYIIRDNPARDVFSAYKVDSKTGAETPVYGISGQNFKTRTLRDINYSGDNLEVYNFGSAREDSYSITSPSVILSELEFIPTQKPPVSQPLVSKP